MKDAVLSLVSITMLGLLLSNSAVVAQEKSHADAGFWIQITLTDRKDSLSVSASRQFIDGAQIKTLPLHSVPLPDHKTNAIINWEGVYLRDVVQKFLDIAWEKIDRLIIKAPDGYSSVVSNLRLKAAETALCAFAKHHKDWPPKFGYLRIIFPDLHEMHWMNNPNEVELILKKEQEPKPTWKFVIFDSPAFQPIQANQVEEDFTGWSVNDILTTLDRRNRVFGVFTLDGQVREYLFDEIAQRMKLAPDSTGYWKIRGERIPIGFRLRTIFFLYSENIGVFTKSLTPEEQLLWQNLFASIHPPTNEGLPAQEIIVVLASGEKILSRYIEDYRAGRISLYQLMQLERDGRKDLVAIEASW